MQGQRIGYVRVSTVDQNPERQLEKVQVDRVYTDTASGKDTQRPALAALLTFIREGDTVVVHSMDRLARNLDDLRRLVQHLTQRGVRITFLKEHLTFTGEDTPWRSSCCQSWAPLRSSSGRCSGNGSARTLCWPSSGARIAAAEVAGT
jgi:hypothetical protein